MSVRFRLFTCSARILCCAEVVGGDVEEALDRVGVEVQQKEAVGSGQRDDVRDQLGTDRLSRLGLPLLSRVGVVGDHRGHPAGRCAAKGVQDDEQLHQVLVDRMAGGLEHEAVVAAHRVLDLERRSPRPKSAGPGDR